MFYYWVITFLDLWIQFIYKSQDRVFSVLKKFFIFLLTFHFPFMDGPRDLSCSSLSIFDGATDIISLTTISYLFQYVSILRPPVDEEGRVIQLSDLYKSSADSASEWRQVKSMGWRKSAFFTPCSYGVYNINTWCNNEGKKAE